MAIVQIRLKHNDDNALVFVMREKKFTKITEALRWCLWKGAAECGAGNAAGIADDIEVNASGKNK